MSTRAAAAAPQPRGSGAPGLRRRGPADKAKVVYAPRERFLPHGKPASLNCHFSANPPLTNLRWEKDGFLFDPYNVPGVFYSRNGSLLFNQVRVVSILYFI